LFYYAFRQIFIPCFLNIHPNRKTYREFEGRLIIFDKFDFTLYQAWQTVFSCVWLQFKLHNTDFYTYGNYTF
ncbi:MAG: hypothetical protein ACYDCN_15495, partial [Bacteroidia bacterium]